MCGRFALPIPFAELASLLRGLVDVAVGEPTPAESERFRPSWNVAPRALVPALVAGGTGRAALRLLRWGLVPHWASDPSIGDRLINARGDTIATKPSFRDAWKRRRCLVPVTAFYEWRAEGGRKRPWAFASAEAGRPLLLGGIHERWKGPDGAELATVALVTTGPNALVAPVHDRMPVVVAPADAAVWLGIGAAETAPPSGLLAAADPASMRAWPVSTRVSDARNDGPECLAPDGG